MFEYYDMRVCVLLACRVNIQYGLCVMVIACLSVRNMRGCDLSVCLRVRVSIVIRRSGVIGVIVNDGVSLREQDNDDVCI